MTTNVWTLLYGQIDAHESVSDIQSSGNL